MKSDADLTLRTYKMSTAKEKGKGQAKDRQTQGTDPLPRHT